MKADLNDGQEDLIDESGVPLFLSRHHHLVCHLPHTQIPKVLALHAPETLHPSDRLSVSRPSFRWVCQESAGRFSGGGGGVGGVENITGRREKAKGR